MGWGFAREIERGMIELVFIPQPEIKNTGAVGFFATDIPYGFHQISRFGVEETVVDGVILLSSTEEGFDRQRYVEVYKLRNTAHLKGRHSMVIATLLVGSPGIGKSTLGLQFILEGARRKERGLLFTLEEGPEQIEATADALGMPLRNWIEKGLVEIVYLSRGRVRSAQFLTILGDKIRNLKARRVLLDDVTHAAHESIPLLRARNYPARILSGGRQPSHASLRPHRRRTRPRDQDRENAG